MAQQTAVDWLMEQMLKPDMYKIWPTLLERAKEMEQEQIIDSYLDGVYQALDNDEAYDNWKTTGEQYYNETYGKKMRQL
jgi:histone acetyltransferase (RNA polymerase elongator complex component)